MITVPVLILVGWALAAAASAVGPLRAARNAAGRSVRADNTGAANLRWGDAGDGDAGVEAIVTVCVAATPGLQ